MSRGMPTSATTPTPAHDESNPRLLGSLGRLGTRRMDSFIYALVLTPAITELLPKSGIEATPGNVGYYGSLLFALFLFGWGCSMIRGRWPIASVA